MCMAERLELEMSKSGSKEQDLIANTCEVKSEGITNSNWLNRDFQIINYNI